MISPVVLWHQIWADNELFVRLGGNNFQEIWQFDNLGSNEAVYSVLSQSRRVLKLFEKARSSFRCIRGHGLIQALSELFVTRSDGRRVFFGPRLQLL